MMVETGKFRALVISLFQSRGRRGGERVWREEEARFRLWVCVVGGVGVVPPEGFGLVGTSQKGLTLSNFPAAAKVEILSSALSALS